MHLNIDGARVAADQASARWRDGKPRSPIDGMPIGIKDIIETIDMPTENGSPLFAGWRTGRDGASVAALRAAGAVILGKTVTTEFAASEPRGTRNPHDLERTPGGSSSGSAAAVAAGMVSTALGTQVIGSTIRPASYCGCVGYKVSAGALNRGGSYDGLSQSATGVLAVTLSDAWQVACEIAVRAGGDPGHPGLAGPASVPAPIMPQRIGFLETAGWAAAAAGARTAMADALARLEQGGITVLTRRSHRGLDAVETAIAPARALSMRINAWESRWPLNTYRERDASRLSRAMLDRLAEAEAMSLEDYRAVLAQRDAVRAAYAGLAASARSASAWPRRAPHRWACNPPAIPAAPCMPRCSAFPRSRCRCWRTAVCRSACRSPASPIATPTPSRPRPRSSSFFRQIPPDLGTMILTG